MNNCKGCEVRYVGCHGSYESYLAYQNEREMIKVNRKKTMLVYDYYRDMQTKQLRYARNHGGRE